jgi:hypothetical protein
VVHNQIVINPWGGMTIYQSGVHRFRASWVKNRRRFGLPALAAFNGNREVRVAAVVQSTSGSRLASIAGNFHQAIHMSFYRSGISPVVRRYSPHMR